MKELGEILRSWRARALISQDELAERTGLSARTIRRLESGDTFRPRLSSLDLLGRALGLSEHERIALTTVLGESARGQAVVPAQLPLAPIVFVGRHDELAEITVALGQQWVTAISGNAGVGKSALVLHAAHLVAGRFPDGQLYVNLNGHRAGLRPLDTIDVLGRFLRALGYEPSSIPAGVDEAAAQLRTMLATRSVLIVLDNAASVAQVQPLLPGAGPCRVLVTSRRPMPTLDGRHLVLDVMSEPEAIELLTVWAGQPRVASDPDSARAITLLCDRLPLALRVAGARMSADPAISLASMRRRLTAERSRLDLLRMDDLAVRTAFQTSYEELDGPTAEAFRLLSLLRVADIGTAQVAALMDTSAESAQITMDRLVDARLVDRSGDRVRLHDLLRLFAAELSRDHDSEELVEHAIGRALICYLGAARRASDMVRPGQVRPGDDELADARYANLIPLSDAVEANEWVESELGNLIALARQTADMADPLCRFALRLAGTLQMFLPLRGYLREWEDLTDLSLRIARRLADLPAQAVALSDLGAIAQRFGRFDDALGHLNDALIAARTAGRPTTEAAIYSYLASTYASQGDTENTVNSMRRTVQLRRQIGDLASTAVTLGNCAVYSLAVRQYSQAIAYAEESIDIAVRAGDRQSEGVSEVTVAAAYLARGRLADAMTAVRAGLDLCREYGNRYHEWIALILRADVERRAGRTEESIRQLRRAVEVCQLHGEDAGISVALRSLQRLGVPADERIAPEFSRVARTPIPAWLVVALGLDAEPGPAASSRTGS